MHVSKIHSLLVCTLPIDFKDDTLHKHYQVELLIKKVVDELTVLGLDPVVLHDHPENVDSQSGPTVSTSRFSGIKPHQSKLKNGTVPSTPSLKLWIRCICPDSADSQLGTFLPSARDGEQGNNLYNGIPLPFNDVGSSLWWILQHTSGVAVDDDLTLGGPDGDYLPLCTGAGGELIREDMRESVLSLPANEAVFASLANTLESLSTRLRLLHSGFIDTLTSLSRSISDCGRPVSWTSAGFHPYSSSDAKNIAVHVPYQGLTTHKSDLDTWREIFQVYMELEIFENTHEGNCRTIAVEEADKRLKMFVKQLESRGVASGQKLKLKQSRRALQIFLGLNIYILDVRKFQYANFEATQKIIETVLSRKSTSLQLPDGVLVPHKPASLARILVQAIHETLLPVIPHIDDYTCLICTSIAFKPIRLACGHMFCVRCLVKMQKRGDGNCPLCRAPTVLKANSTNIDWAMMNFMRDWFPTETRTKLKHNEREVAEEELQEMGFNIQGCIIV